MWLGVFAWRHEEPKFQKFRENYFKFLKEDIVWICVRHHAEVHILYDKIIEQHKALTQKPLSKYTWHEAEHLMDSLEAACRRWLKYESEGLDPRVLDRVRERQAKGRKRKSKRKRK